MEPCTSESDCSSQNYCDFDKEECRHDDVFPLTAVDVVAYVLIGLCLGISNVGGLGAGTAKIFVLILILNYSQGQATNYIFPCMLAQKIADSFMLFFRKHPFYKKKPVIDFNIVMVFLPSLLLGSAIGSSFNPIVPSFILQVIVIVFISVALYLTLKKAKIFLEQRKQENKLKIQSNDDLKEEKQQEKIEEQSSGDSQKQAIEKAKEQQQTQIELQYKSEEPLNKQNKQEYEESTNSLNNDNNQKQQQVSEILQKLLDNENKIPFKKIGLIVTIFLLLFLLYGFLGGDGSDSFVGIDFCSTGYWVLFGFQLPIYGIFFLVIRHILKNEDDTKVKEGYELKKFEISYTKQGISKFIMNGFACGLIDGLVGFGGPLMIIPTMVNLGIHPRTATASTSFLLLFSSGIAVIIGVLSGQIETNALILLFCVSLVGAFLFTFGLNKLIDYFKLDSLTILFTSFVQLALLGSSIGLFIGDLVNKDFSDLISSKSYC